MKKLLTIFLFLISCIFVCNTKALAATNTELIKGAKSGILIEEKTNTILYEKDKDKELSMASMTKIMSLLLIYEALDNNTISKNDILTVSKNAAEMGGSQVYLEENEKISIDEAIKCLCIVSANDCAVALAEAIYGSEEQFVIKMNEKAQALNCKHTKFSDCTGLSSKDHYSSALDMSIMARELILKHPDVVNYTNMREDYIRKDSKNPFWLVNTNKLIGRINGLDGLKTGYTSFSGYCITLHMTNNNMGLISVVFGYETSEKRNTESLELLRYGFNNYEIYNPYKQGEIIYEKKNILYKGNKLSYSLDKDIYMVIKKNERNNYSNSLDGNKVYIYKDTDSILTEEAILLECEKKNFLTIIKDLFVIIFN